VRTKRGRPQALQREVPTVLRLDRRGAGQIRRLQGNHQERGAQHSHRTVQSSGGAAVAADQRDSLLNNTIELGEKLYLSTGSEGREVISGQLQELQQAFEALFDGINSTDRDLKAKLTR
jgi:hypothetical protein